MRTPRLRSEIGVSAPNTWSDPVGPDPQESLARRTGPLTKALAVDRHKLGSVVRLPLWQFVAAQADSSCDLAVSSTGSHAAAQQRGFSGSGGLKAGPSS